MEGILLLQVISGSIFLLTITLVGMRLLMLAKRSRKLPELLLGLSLIVGGTFGASLEAGGLAIKLEVEPSVVGMLLLAGKTCGALALGFQGFFIWKVFRPDSAWAPVLIGVCISVTVASLVGFGFSGTFSTGHVPMIWFWPELLARTAGSAWLVFEAIRYYRLMRRRQAIGLGDPVISNRFLLWAIGGVCGMLMMLTAVPPVLDPNSTHPMMAFDILAFSAFGIGFSVAYSLVFFPPAAYLQWIGVRAAARAA